MIRKLGEDWRDRNFDNRFNDGESICPVVCADELEAALPKWTRITEDESTLPPTGQMIMLGYPDGGHKSIITMIEQKWVPTGHYVGKAWRPLCDLDYPPEQES